MMFPTPCHTHSPLPPLPSLSRRHRQKALFLLSRCTNTIIVSNGNEVTLRLPVLRSTKVLSIKYVTLQRVWRVHVSRLTRVCFVLRNLWMAHKQPPQPPTPTPVVRARAGQCRAVQGRTPAMK